MKKLSLFVALCILAIACNKDEETVKTPGDNPPVSSFSELKIPEGFQWTSSVKGPLKVMVKAPSYLSLENQEVQLITESGDVIAVQKLENASADFQLSLPAEHEKLYAYLPNTGTYAEVTAAGHVSLEVADFKAEDPLANADVYPFDISGNKKKSSMSGNELVNGDFESDVDSSYDGSLGSLIGNWQMLTNRNNARIKVVNGSRVLSSSNNEYIQFAQVIPAQFRRKYEFNFRFSGNSNGRLYLYRKNGSLIGYVKPSRNTATGEANVNITLAKDVYYMEARVYTKGSDGWIDDVELNLVAEPDSDKDGIVDRIDDFPNDATKAFASYYPLVGRQTVAFEDLWPNTGDYDFNDMVLSNLVTFGSDKDGNLVDARFQVKVNAMGAGLPNGIGIKLYRPDGTAFSTDIIGNFAGEGQVDPQVQNGIIVTDNVKNIRPIYWNTGVGPEATPKEFDFTISFNSNMDEDYVLPDMYIYRTTDRGREIHLPGFAATEAANPTYFDTGKDVNGTYLTKENFPWAIEILYPGTLYFNHPREHVDITQAYPYFQQWAESGGSRYVGWMVIPNNGKVFKN